jgi:cytochrome c2
MPVMIPRVARCVLALAAAALVAGCTSQAAKDNGHPVSGDATAGAALIRKLGCGSCHDIPGIVDAHGMVGPPLGHIARRQFIAGVLRNTPDNMTTWLRFPQRIVPGNAMPDLAISDHDARQITAYLATLK